MTPNHHPQSGGIGTITRPMIGNVSATSHMHVAIATWSQICEQAALRELTEETGFRAMHIALLGRFISAPGLTSHMVSVFLGSGLQGGTQQLDAHEVIEVVLMEWQDLQQLVLSGEPVDGALGYAVLRYMLRLQHDQGLVR